MPLKCIAIDDEPPALALLREFISRQPGLQLLQTFEDAIAGGEFLRRHPVDLLFIDINMPDISGLDLVRSLGDPPMVIFTTAHKKFAIDGFELDAIDYLLKPIHPERFSKSVHKALEYAEYKSRQTGAATESLFVYSEYRMVKLLFSDILYIESMEDYIRIHRTNEKPVMTLMTMKKVMEKLPASQFSRIHRSYIVAHSIVQSIQNRKARLLTGTELPISDSYLSFIDTWKNA